MAMLPFNFYMLLSRDVVCSVMLDGCATFAVSTNCRPESATGALYAAGNAGPRGDAIFFGGESSSMEGGKLKLELHANWQPKKNERAFSLQTVLL